MKPVHRGHYTFSDGVPESRAPGGKFFGDDTLEHFLSEQMPVESASSLLENLEKTLFDFIADADQFDDITMMAVRRRTLEEMGKTGQSDAAASSLVDRLL